MTYQFKRHYTREEARALLPKVRRWLERLDQSRERLEEYDGQVREGVEAGRDTGGKAVNTWVRLMAEIREILFEFQSRDILLKDLDRGLLDFPAIIGGREVFLCWEKDEEDIEFWHELHTGYAGRERL